MTGLRLGSATIVDALFAVGEPSHVYLSTAETLGRGKKTDPITLQYSGTFRVAAEYPARVRINARPGDYVIDVIRVDFERDRGPQGGPSRAEIVATYGRSFREVRRRFVETKEGEDEAALVNCDDPAGEFRSLFYQSWALEVDLDEQNLDQVTALRFSSGILDGSEVVPPCVPAGKVTGHP